MPLKWRVACEDYTYARHLSGVWRARTIQRTPLKWRVASKALRFRPISGETKSKYVTGSGKRDIFAQTMIFQISVVVRRNVIFFIP